MTHASHRLHYRCSDSLVMVYPLLLARDITHSPQSHSFLLVQHRGHRCNSITYHGKIIMHQHACDIPRGRGKLRRTVCKHVHSTSITFCHIVFRSTRLRWLPWALRCSQLRSSTSTPCRILFRISLGTAYEICGSH